MNILVSDCKFEWKNKEKKYLLRMPDIITKKNLCLLFQLSVYGFKNIDGLDPSEGMLKQCKNKGVYKKLYQEFCSDQTLPIDDGA